MNFGQVVVCRARNHCLCGCGASFELVPADEVFRRTSEEWHEEGLDLIRPKKTLNSYLKRSQVYQ